MLPALLLLACEDRDRDTGVTQHWVVWDDTGPGDTDTHRADSGDTAPDTDEETGDTGEPCPPDTETVLWLCNAESSYLGRPGEYASSAAVGDFDGDGQLGLAISAPFSSYGTGYEEGLVYVVNDPTPGTTELSTMGDLVYGSGGGFKLQVGATLDANSDGTTDAALYEWTSIDMETEVYLLTGPLVGLRSVTQAELVVSGAYDSLLRPEDVSGDLDGDGSPELLLRTYLYGEARTGAMVAFPAGWTGRYAQEDAAWAITWAGDPSEGEFAGAVVADLTGDGTDDLVLGTPLEGGSIGGIRLFDGPIAGSLTEQDAIAARWGAGDDFWVGYTNTSCDFNGDGHLDLAAGVPSGGPVAEASGAVWIDYGPLNGDDLLANAGVGIFGRSPGETLGRSLAAGDLDGDSVCELSVGGMNNDSSIVFVWQEIPEGRWYEVSATLTIQSERDAGYAVQEYGTHGGRWPADVVVGWTPYSEDRGQIGLLDPPWAKR